MKLTTLPRTLALVAALSGNALALTPVTEDFAAKNLNGRQWSLYKTGKAKLKQGKGLLNLFCPKLPIQNDYTTIELTTSYPGYDENWQFTVDLAKTSGKGSRSGCGFMIVNKDDEKRGDYLYFEFSGKSGIAGGVIVNGKQAKSATFTAASVPESSFKVAYNKTTNLLTISASATGAGEEAKWKKIVQFSPTGTGGDVRGNWEMDATGKFAIQLLGFTDGVIVPKGKVNLDNFVLSAGN